jgi:hypothetical protein
MSDGLKVGEAAAHFEPVFPVAAEVPETKRHLKLRTLLCELLELAFADQAAIGCDQFVYWDPHDPKACLAPDAFVRLGQPDFLFRSWKVWEQGVPQVAVEIISESDERDRDWAAKLGRYQELGVLELVRFDPDSLEAPLRVWDRVDGELLERPQPPASTPSHSSHWLAGHWLVRDSTELGPTLRLSQDPEGTSLYPTRSEAAEEAHQRAARRVLELEAELKRLAPR